MISVETVAHFRIDAKIGEGGMGVVYRATDEKLGRTVALKVLPESFARDDERRSRFLREARVAAGLTHPNVVTVYEVGEAEGRIYIAMELVEGVSLRARLGGFPIPLASPLEIAIGIARGHAHAHHRGIVHRDLKPDNVMVNDELGVKVLDFGLARSADVDVATANTAFANLPSEMRTRDGLIIGTPGYMSPEQADGGPVDLRTDVFAFGIMLYEMLTGLRPFVGATPTAIAIAAARDAPRAPSEVNQAIPPQREQLIQRCRAKRPDDRYPTARAILSELDDREQTLGTTTDRPAVMTTSTIGSLATELAGVAEPPRVEPTRPKPRSASRFAWAGACVLALASVVAGTYSWSRGKPSAGGPGAPSATVSGAPATSVTAVTDLPLPPSKSRDALAAYSAGLQALRDDAYGRARAHFGRAVELDDTMAMAHLRLAIAMMYTQKPVLFREHFAKAVSGRGQLGERDQALLDAFEPVLGRAHDDRVECFERLKKLTLRYPKDVELLDLVAAMRSDDEGGLAYVDRAIELDPKDAQALETRGRILGALGRIDEAHAAMEQCTKTSVGTTDCFFWLSQLDASAGRCEDAERDIQRGVDRDPKFIRILDQLMIAAHRPPEAVREVMRQGQALLEGVERRSRELSDETVLAILAGDFTRAKKLAAESAAVVESDVQSAQTTHLHAASLQTDLAIEMGDDASVFPIARSFVVRSDSWASEDLAVRGLNESMLLLRRAVHTGGLSAGEFEERRAAWVAARQQTSGAEPALVWVYGYALPAQNADEAKAALAALPRFGRLVWFPMARSGNPDAAVGHVYLLAGRFDEALPFLKKAAASCNLGAWPFLQQNAALDLGATLEHLGDERGACDAYKGVVDRWGNAKPRSVTAEKARARLRALPAAPASVALRTTRGRLRTGSPRARRRGGGG